MEDEVDCRAQRLLDRLCADQLLLGLGPIGGAFGQLLLADDDENVLSRFILVSRQRRIDPVAACVAAEEDDLEDASALAPPGCLFGRGTKRVEDSRDDLIQLALLDGGKVIEIGAHRSAERRVGQECARTCRSRWWPYR